jgi:hypothetical protein
MAWVRMDDKRALNKKLRAAGFAARGLDEAAIEWSAHEEDDGFISDEDVEMLANMHGCSDSVPLTSALKTVGRWSRNNRKGGWHIKDYLDFNPSHADLESKRQRDRERKRTHNGFHVESNGKPDGSREDG